MVRPGKTKHSQIKDRDEEGSEEKSGKSVISPRASPNTSIAKERERQKDRETERQKDRERVSERNEKIAFRRRAGFHVKRNKRKRVLWELN